MVSNPDRDRAVATQPAVGTSHLGYVFGAFGAEAVPGPCLIDLLQQLGMGESAARTMLSRQTRRGQLTSTRHARVAVYRLAGAYRERFQRIRLADEPAGWTGAFELIMYDIGEDRRRDRDALREQAAAAGFGAVRPGVLIGLSDPADWCRPWLDRDDLFIRAGRLACTEPVAADLADRAWNLTATAPRMRAFVARTKRVRSAAERRPNDTSYAFTAFAEVMREFTWLHLEIPMLPPAITPTGWPGAEIQKALVDLSQSLGPRVREHAYATAAAHDLTHLVEPLDQRPAS